MPVDYKTKKILAVQLTPNEKKRKTAQKFFDKIFSIYPNVIITDLKLEYHELIRDEMHIEH